MALPSRFLSQERFVFLDKEERSGKKIVTVLLKKFLHSRSSSKTVTRCMFTVAVIICNRQGVKSKSRDM